MKKKKIFLSLLLVFSFLFLLTSCDFLNNDSGSKDSNEENNNELEFETYQIYKLATDSGFTGTYEEWLASIKGSEIELKVIDNVLKWKYSNENEIMYRTLLDFSSIKGEPGNNIVSIDLDNSYDIYDTYKITMSNGEYYKFVVTNGKEGIQGIQGEKGEDGHTPVITIVNGKWYIDGENTNISAKGTKGDTGNGISSIIKISSEGLVDTYSITFTNGTTTSFTVTNGTQGIQGIQGEKGADGHSPIITIGENGNWFIDNVDTTKPSSIKGDTGNGISSVLLTNTVGLVDTYTITFTNGTTTSFTVTNGAKGDTGLQGIQGIQGEKGADGHSPIITIGENGNWFIDNVDTTKPSNIKGDTGKSAYEIYLEYHPEYNKSEEEWLDDLVNDRLANNELLTVSFIVDGNIVETQNVEFGFKAECPEIYSKYGYEFLGWFDENGQKWSFIGHSVTENINLYANYALNDNSLEFYNMYKESISTYGLNSLNDEANSSNLISLYKMIDYEIENKMFGDYSIDKELVISTLNYKELNITFEDAQYVWKIWKLDHPLAYFVSNTFSLDEEYLYLKIDEEYSLLEIRNKYNSQIYSNMMIYLEEAQNYSYTYDKVLLLHDRICQNAYYHYDENNNPSNEAYDHNVIGVLIENKGVCESYAKTYQALLNILGIENIVVTGNSNKHIWNYLKIDNNWYAVDVTWDDDLSYGLGAGDDISHNYFIKAENDYVTYDDYGWNQNKLVFNSEHIAELNSASGLDKLYSLPNLSDNSYSNDSVFIIRNTVEIDIFTFTRVSIDEVKLCKIKQNSNIDTLYIPQKITVNNLNYFVTEIGGINPDGSYNAFSIIEIYDYFSIEKIIIHSNIKKIDHSALSGFIGEYIVDNNNKFFSSSNKSLFTKNLYTLIKVPANYDQETYIIPNETRIIAYHAFDFVDNVKDIIIGEKLEGIGYANWGSGWLDADPTDWFGGNYVSELYYSSGFNSMSLLENIIVVENNQYFKSLNGILYSKNMEVLYCYPRLNKSEELVISSSLTRFDAYVASEYLMKLIIEEDVTDISFVHISESPLLFDVYNSSINISSEDILSIINKKIVIHNNLAEKSIVTLIDGYMFAYYDEEAHLVNYNGSNTDLILPNEIILNNQTITSYIIDTNAFKNKNIKSVYIPDNVISISANAFNNCINLQSIRIPFIGESKTENNYFGYIFGGDRELEYNPQVSRVPKTLFEVVLGDEIIDIPYHAFYFCQNINRIVIPKSVESIDNNAFDGCYKLVEVYNLSNIDLENNSINAYYLKNHNSLDDESILRIYDDFIFVNYNNTISLIGYLGNSINLKLPRNVIIDNNKIDEYEIYKFAFFDYIDIKSLDIPSDVNVINDQAFNYCLSLEKITFGKNIDMSQGSLFLNARSIHTIYFDGTIDDWCDINLSNGSNILCNKDFYVLDKLGETLYNDKMYSLVEKIELSPSVSYIGDYQFYGIKNVKTIKLPNSIIGIGNTAFGYISSLEYLYLSNNLEFIGDFIVDGCDNLKYNISKNIKYLGNDYNPFIYLVGVNSNSKKYEINNNCKFIKNYALQNCDLGEEVIIPDSVVFIGHGAFNGCNSIKTLKLPFIGQTIESNQYLGYIFGAYDMYNAKEYVPNSLKTIEISNKCNEIPDNAFASLNNIKNVILSNNITSIGRSAFSGCTSLEKIVLPDSVKEIKEYAFMGCYNLAIIDLANVEIIRSCAFYNCRNLISIVIPNTVKIIESTFYECEKLVEIYNLSIVDIYKYNPNLEDDLLVLHTNLNEDSIVHQIDDYTVSLTGKVFLMSYNGDDNNLSLPEYFIINNHTYYEYSIYKYAFYDKNITNINIPDCVQSIGYNSINENLEYNTYDNAFYIGNNDNPYLFLVKAKDKNITSCIINQYCKFIMPYAFSGCEALEELVIPNSVIEVGKGALYGCSKLNSLTVPFVGMNNTENQFMTYIFGGTVYYDYGVIPSSLKIINISNNCTSISTNAFTNFTNLEILVLHNNLSYIYPYSFYNCTSLSKVYYDGKYSITKIGEHNEFLELATWYYFTENGEEETEAGNWWYYDPDGTTIIEKIIE